MLADAEKLILKRCGSIVMNKDRNLAFAALKSLNWPKCYTNFNTLLSLSFSTSRNTREIDLWNTWWTVRWRIIRWRISWLHIRCAGLGSMLRHRSRRFGIARCASCFIISARRYVPSYFTLLIWTCGCNEILVVLLEANEVRVREACEAIDGHCLYRGVWLIEFIRDLTRRYINICKPRRNSLM